MKEWFATWFDSPYYHILYQHRDYKEAEEFISNLLVHLKPKPYSRILDLACGKGRHSLFLAEKKMDVTGVDLSPQSIEHAQKQQHMRLKFQVHDMRKIHIPNYYNYVFNLFTSFGYFENELDNLSTIQAMRGNLRRNGKLVIDFFNAEKVQNNLVAEEDKLLNDITFHITRKIENERVVKTINFEAEGKAFEFEESVQLIDLKKFEYYLERCEFELIDTFGNYNLDPFNPIDSDRLILLARKPND